MIKDLINSIVDNLSTIPYFKDYKYRKKDFSFIKKTMDGFNSIQLQFWDGYDLERDCRALVINPLYLKRFDVLHKWFEKHSFKSLSDQRNSYSIGFEGKMINATLQFYFKLDEIDFDNDFSKFKDEIIEKSQEVFEKYNSLKDLYDIEIIPILNGNKELPNVGADWVFEFLKLCFLVSPENYNKLKHIILKQIEVMYERGEPNIIEYYPNLKNILLEIEKEV